MANEPVEPVAPAPVVAPVEAAPVAAPAVVEPVAAPAVEPAPVAPVETPAEAPKEPEPDALKPHTDTPSLLEEALKPEGEKTPETKVGEDGKPIEPPKADAPAVIKFEPYKLPEGFKADDTKIGTFNDILAKDLPPQDRGQALVDLHVKELQAYNHQLRQSQHDAFAETRAGWRKQVMADPELGGAGFQTAMQAVAQVRDQFVSRHKQGTDGYKKDIGDFDTFLKTTGAGDHPAFLRFVHNVARWYSEPAAPAAPYKPPTDIGRAPNTRRSLRDAYKTVGSGS